MDYTDVYSPYAALKELHKILSKSPVIQKSENTKSYAQVETSVRRLAVGHKSCGLKPDEPKEFRITVRFSKNEREILVGHAEKIGLTMSEHIRVSALGPTYAYAVDPERFQLLRQAVKELNRQGVNLNQIAHQMNAQPNYAADGETRLGEIAQNLIAAQKAVRQALSEGKTYI